MQNLRENKMGTMPINKLLLSVSLPMIASMLVQALYNIVDSVFVSMYNADAFTAVSLAFPLQNLMIAFATGTGVGINALLSKALAKKTSAVQTEPLTTAFLSRWCTMLYSFWWEFLV